MPHNLNLRHAAPAYLLWVAIPILTMLNQACIKLLALQMKETAFGWEWMAQALHTPWALGILLCECASFVLWITILAETSISKATPITALAYILILLMSWTFFKEQVMLLQIFGSALILAGVWLIGTASNDTTHVEAML